MANKTPIINEDSLNFPAIRADLQEFALSKPEYQRWKDFTASSAGAMIMDFIAGIGAFEVYHSLARYREQQVDTFTTLEGGYNIAKRKGIMFAPNAGARFAITVDFEEPITLTKGQVVGYLANYELYAADDYTLTQLHTEIEVVVGKILEFTGALSSYSQFSKLHLNLGYKYIAAEFEQFLADTLEVTLTNENNLFQDQTGLLLRNYTDSGVDIYFGNGILGWYSPMYQNYTYKCLAYNSDLSEALKATPALIPELEMVGSPTLITPPAFGYTLEDLRALIRFNRTENYTVVTDEDYQYITLKQLSAYLHSAYAHNTNPIEEIELLWHDDITDEQIEELVTNFNTWLDKRRGLGMKIQYNNHRVADGLLFTTQLHLDDLTQENMSKLDQIATNLENKFLTEDVFPFTTANEFASWLSIQTGTRVVIQEAENYFFEPTQYFRKVEFLYFGI